MVDYQTIGILIAAASVVIGVINSILTSRREEKRSQTTLETRQAQLFMQLFSIYDTKDFLEDYGKLSYLYEYEDLSDWQTKYGALNDISAYASWARVGRFFDGAGILVKKKLIDVDLVTELLREIVIYSWEKMQTWVVEVRQMIENPEVWENFEYLYDEVRKRTQQLSHEEMMPLLRQISGVEQ